MIDQTNTSITEIVDAPQDATEYDDDQVADAVMDELVSHLRMNFNRIFNCGINFFEC